MTGFCSDCDREFAADYPSWQSSDSTCGMSPAWNAHGERHDDCINECLLASRNRYRDEANARDEALARVEHQCAEALARMRAQKADLRLEVAAWRALAAREPVVGLLAVGIRDLAPKPEPADNDPSQMLKDGDPAEP